MAQVRIFQRAKTTMQSGRGQTRKWILEHLPATARRPDPLMGWASAEDTLNQVRLHFDSPDEACAFAERKGFDYTIIVPQRAVSRLRSYADNFRYERMLA